MKISVDSESNILLEEVYSGIGLKTRDGEFMGICMRDSGFEFSYEGRLYSAQKGLIQIMDNANNKCQGKETNFIQEDITNNEEQADG